LAVFVHAKKMTKFTPSKYDWHKKGFHMLGTARLKLKLHSHVISIMPVGGEYEVHVINRLTFDRAITGPFQNIFKARIRADEIADSLNL
jgi:hypothetical protein